MVRAVNPVEYLSEGQKVPGASTFNDPANASVQGQYHVLSRGTVLPEGLGVVFDGGQAGTPIGHYTIYPIRDMPFVVFVEKFLSLVWTYAGKKK